MFRSCCIRKVAGRTVNLISVSWVPNSMGELQMVNNAKMQDDLPVSLVVYIGFVSFVNKNSVVVW